MAQQERPKPRNADELRKAIEADELQDAHDAALEGTARMSVSEYAKHKKMQPQLLYYYIRRGYIKEGSCPECGRKTIDVASADKHLAEREAEARAKR